MGRVFGVSLLVEGLVEPSGLACGALRAFGVAVTSDVPASCDEEASHVKLCMSSVIMPSDCSTSKRLPTGDSKGAGGGERIGETTA